MDPKHRDRIAFLRVCSGKFERNKRLFHVREKKEYRASNPTAFMAQEKNIIDVAYPGDIVGLDQLSDEGMAQLFSIPNSVRKMVGTVGELQFDVIQYRLKHEYQASCRFDGASFIKACWITAEDPAKLTQFIKNRMNQIVYDKDARPVYLAETQWSLDREIREHPEILFSFYSDL